MFYLKLSLTGLLVVTFYGLVLCSDENINKQLTPQENNEQLNKTVQELVKNVTNPRSARTLLTNNNRNPAFMLRRRQPTQIRARADHIPIRTQIRRVYNGLPNGQQSQQQNLRLGYESAKSSKYLPSSKVANLPFLNNGKGSPYRPQLITGHPNSVHAPPLAQQYMHNFKASPAFNGQVVVHPVPQTQKQQSNTPQQDNSYPKYIKPQQQPASAVVSSQLQSQQQQKASLLKYSDFKQYPIPDQEKMQQHNEQHEKYLQQQKFVAPKKTIPYHQLQHPQQQYQEIPLQQQQSYEVQHPLPQLPPVQQQQPSIPIHASAQTKKNNVHFPTAIPKTTKMYSVYEENDMTELQSNNYQTAAYQELDQEIQEYLRFMNTDEYFLPKKDPNYKILDDETDKQQYNALKAQAQQILHPLQQSQAAATSYHQSPPQQTAYQPSVYTPSSSSQNTQYSNSLYSDTSDTSAYSQGIPVSRLYYQPDPPIAASASSTVLRTSYQTGYNQNQFVVSSQDNKIGRYTITPTTATNSFALPTQSPILYSQLRHNTAGNRTPEPLRFEFTERDAMVGGFSYTNAPQGQLRYKQLASNNVTPIVPNVGSSTIKNTVKTQNYSNGKLSVKPVVNESGDDPEDGDDMQESGNNLFGRQTVKNNAAKANKLSSTTEAPPSERKDTEEYCERICAIVEDENEEIVCGSDGYMYTSEAQMECYASCLHIDVTIQGKGSCSKR